LPSSNRALRDRTRVFPSTSETSVEEYRKLKKGAAVGSTTSWSFAGFGSARSFAFTGYVAMAEVYPSLSLRSGLIRGVLRAPQGFRTTNNARTHAIKWLGTAPQWTVTGAFRAQWAPQVGDRDTLRSHQGSMLLPCLRRVIVAMWCLSMNTYQRPTRFAARSASSPRHPRPLTDSWGRDRMFHHCPTSHREERLLCHKPLILRCRQ